MVAGARTLTIEETFLDPQVLDPPPTRHALFLSLLALAAILHLATAGWSDLHDGVEGQFAGGAREMASTQQWLTPTNNGIPRPQTPPLLYWLIVLSYKIFGVSATAARLPVSLGMIASVALTFLIGERLAGYWRGFAAGLIYLCSGGAFLLGRTVAPDPVFSAFVAGAIFCALCGYQRRQYRRTWFAGFWLCAGLACLCQGLIGILYLGGVCLLLAIFFREARLRFRSLLHWAYVLLFVAMVAPWYFWAQQHFPGFFSHSPPWLSDSPWPRWQFLLLQFAWWFPASILILPGLLFATRRVIRPQEISFAEALPLCWMAVGLLLALAMGPTLYSSINLLGAFALWAALAWERTPKALQRAGLVFLALAGVIMGALAFVRPEFLPELASPETLTAHWLAQRQLVEIAGVALSGCALIALYFAIRQRPLVALLLALISMVPIGLCLAEGLSRLAPSYSLAGAARFLNAALGEQGQVIYEGPPQSASTLTFYLNRKFFLVNQPPDFFDQDPAAQAKYLDEPSVLEAWNQSDPIFLIINENRVSHWQELVTAHVHIFHQVTTCGSYVVLSNQL